MGSNEQTEHSVQSKHLVEKQKTKTKDTKRENLQLVTTKLIPYPKSSKFPGNYEVGTSLLIIGQVHNSYISILQEKKENQ